LSVSARAKAGNWALVRDKRSGVLEATVLVLFDRFWSAFLVRSL